MDPILTLKKQLIDDLLKDFNTMFPDSNRETKITLHLRLSLLDVEDLKLLANHPDRDLNRHSKIDSV